MNVYIFDPTATDEKSKVRGIGRYMEILYETFNKDFHFTNNVQSVPTDATFINPFFDFLKPPLVSKRIAKKQIAVIHDIIPLKYPAHFPAGVKGKLNILRNLFAVKNYDSIITDSEVSKQDILEITKFPPEKVQVVYPTISKLFFNNTHHSHHTNIDAVHSKILNPKSLFCLYVGDATWNKNIVNIAKAVQLANVTCVFVCKTFHQSLQISGKLTNAWQRDLQEFLYIVEGDKRFVFPGFISNDELMKLYQQAQCNILVSRDEGFGLSYVEASALGTPSVLANRPIFQEIAQDAALFADPDEPADIAEKMKVYFTGTVRQEFGTKAKARAAFFSPEKFKKEFMQAIGK